MVQEAWNKGEEVPYGVLYLVEPKDLTEKDIQRAKELCKQYGWE